MEDSPSKSRNRILGNFLSLSTLEVVNYIIPLMTLPYLVRVLGPAKFGAVAFAQALVAYFVILTDYGYYLSGPRQISINRNDTLEVSRIFSRILIIKCLLMTITFLVLIIIIFTVPRFTSDKFLYIFAFGNVVGDLLFPTWFFQGMERMKYITMLYLVAKLFFLVAIFVVVRTQEHYVYVPLLNSLGLIIAGIISLVIIRRYFHIQLLLPPMMDIKRELKNEWHFFVSTLSMSFYTYSGVFILGLVAKETYVGYYSAAEKLIRAVQRLLWAGSQSVYPHINRLAAASKKGALRFLRKFSLVFVASFLLASIMIFVLADFIVRILLGPQYLDSVVVLRILAILPFIISVGNVFGVQTMLAFDLKEVFSRILFITASVNLVLVVILSLLYQHIGASIAAVVTECIVAGAAFFYVRGRGLNVWMSK
jgi:PST family polysaccharide transporter